MLTIRVTNYTDAERRWYVEPYGDDVRLSPGDVLEVELEHEARVIVEVGLHPGAEVVWSEVGSGTAVPTSLLLNGVSMWRT